MSVIRIFHSDKINLGEVKLDLEASHHLTRVMRVHCGDHIEVFNGDGYNYTAQICQIMKKQVTVNILESMINKCLPKVDLHLFQGIAEFKKMKWIIQKVSELGAKSLTPIITTKTQKKYCHDLERKSAQLQQVAIQAAMQCGRSTLLDIKPMVAMKQITILDSQQHIALCLDGAQSLSDIQLTSNQPCHLWIGPESGFSPDESEWLRSQQTQGLKLGNTVLRTETAAICGAALLIHGIPGIN